MQSAVLCNTRIDGGGEQSSRWLTEHLGASLVSLTTDEWKTCTAEKQIWYMNNSVYMLHGNEEEYRRVLSHAKEIYIVLNFVLGGTQTKEWLAGYPVKKFLFLNEQKRLEFESKRKPELAHIPTVALPPPVDIDQYLLIDRTYGREQLTVGRHSRISLKYPKDPVPMYIELHKRLPETYLKFQIAHPAIVKEWKHNNWFIFNSYNQQTVRDYLEGIDIYLSIINPNTRDQGPRTLMEAMASGLPCVVDNRDGMKERMVDGLTGFLVNSEREAIDRTVQLATNKDLRERLGRGAREIAKTFRPEKWIKELTNV